MDVISLLNNFTFWGREKKRRTQGSQGQRRTEGARGLAGSWAGARAPDHAKAVCAAGPPTHRGSPKEPQDSGVSNIQSLTRTKEALGMFSRLMCGSSEERAGKKLARGQLVRPDRERTRVMQPTRSEENLEEVPQGLPPANAFLMHRHVLTVYT